VSELRPPTGLLFILRGECEDGDPWWNDIDKGSPPELSGKPTSSHLIVKQEEREVN
jgi:hypothetical protein